MADKAPAAVGTIDVQTAAKLLMISDERVRQLVKMGYIERAEKGRYLLVACVQGYIRFLKDEERRSSKTAASSRKDDARTREIELRIAEREHRLVDVEESEAIVSEIIGMIRSGLAGLPARVTRDVALRRKLKSEIDGLLSKCAARADEAAASVRASGVAASPVADADA